MQAASSAIPQQEALVVHRHKPASQTPVAQSDASVQRTPGHCASTPSGVRSLHAMPSPVGEHALFDGVTRSAAPREIELRSDRKAGLNLGALDTDRRSGSGSRGGDRVCARAAEEGRERTLGPQDGRVP